MGAKAAVIDSSNGGTVLGHIEDDAVSYAEGKGTIVGDSAMRLKEMLGRGYGRRVFTLLLAGSRLEGCRVISPHIVFTYDRMHVLDDDEAPPTFPEHIIDEETPTDDYTRG